MGRGVRYIRYARHVADGTARRGLFRSLLATVRASCTHKPEATRHSHFEMDKHGRPLLALLSLLLCLALLRASSAASVTTGRPDGTERWGYVEVRPSNATTISCISHISILFFLTRQARILKLCFRVAEAHLFWWYYKSPHRVSTPSKPWPTVLWLQGGPVLLLPDLAASRDQLAITNHQHRLLLLHREPLVWVSATSWRSGRWT